jgi:uncharacterized membrane protein
MEKDNIVYMYMIQDECVRKQWKYVQYLVSIKVTDELGECSVCLSVDVCLCVFWKTAKQKNSSHHNTSEQITVKVRSLIGSHVRHSQNRAEM